MSFKVKDGKLYNLQGELVKIEFGNQDQIKFIRDLEKKIEQYDDQGVELDVDIEATYTLTTTIKCLCGKIIYVELEADSDDDYECANGEQKRCYNCKTEYELSTNSEGDLVAKIIK